MAHKKAPKKDESWQARKQRTMQLLKRALEVPQVRGAWDELLACFHQPVLVCLPEGETQFPLESLTDEIVGNLYYRSPDLVRWWSNFVERMQDFFALAQQHLPELCKVSDAELRECLHVLIFEVPGLEALGPWGLAADYLSPEHPGKVLPNGNFLLRKGRRLTSRHDGEMRDFMNAQSPGKPGRRRKNQSPQQTAPRGSDKEQADKERDAHIVLAYSNDQDGFDWQHTARQIYPELDLDNKLQKDAARKRVDRLIFAGEKAARQQVKTKPPKKTLDA